MDDIFLNYGRKQAAAFEEDNIGYTNALLMLGGCRKMLVWIYCLLINYKKIQPIESLPKEQKEQIWEFVKEICIEGHRQKEKMIQMVKVFYTIEYFLNEKK